MKFAGLLGLAAPAALADGMTAKSPWPHLCHQGLVLEGAVPSIPVDPSLPWVLPPLDTDPTTPGSIEPPAFPPGFEVRVRATYLPRTRTPLTLQLFLTPSEVPTPVPLAKEYEGLLLPERALAFYRIAVSAVEVAHQPQSTVTFLGRIKYHNPQFPGFGDLTQATVMVSAIVASGPSGLSAGMLQASIAGSHVSMAPVAAVTALLD